MKTRTRHLPCRSRRIRHPHDLHRGRVRAASHHHRRVTPATRRTRNFAGVLGSTGRRPARPPIETWACKRSDAAVTTALPAPPLTDGKRCADPTTWTRLVGLRRRLGSPPFTHHRMITGLIRNPAPRVRSSVWHSMPVKSWPARQGCRRGPARTAHHSTKRYSLAVRP